MKGRNWKAWPPAAVLATCAVFAVLAAIQWSYTIDDAWIIARYADNLAAGHGWSFNPGERIEGTTTVLWTLLGWLAAELGFHGVTALKAAGLVCGLVAVAFVACRGWKEDGRWERLLAALALAVYVPHSLWSIGGLETAGAGLLGLVGVLLALSPRRADYLAGACLLGLAFLTRPDAGLFWLAIPAAGLLRWWLEGSPPRRDMIEPLCLLAVVAVATTAWRYLQFGAFIPNTALTKAAAPLSAAVIKGLPILQHWFLYQAFGVLVIFAVLGSARRDATRLALLAVLVSWVAYLVALGIPDQPLVFRFYAPLAPLVAMMAAEGVAGLEEGLGRWGRRAGRVALLVPVGFLPVAFNQVWHGTEPYFRSFYSLSERVAGREAAIAFAKEIDELLPPYVSMAISDAGAIPYYAPRRVIDLLGLNDRELAIAVAEMKAARSPEDRRLKHQVYADIVYRREPDFFVHTFIPEVIWKDPRWNTCYRKIVLPHRHWYNRPAGAEFVVYARTCK